MLTRPPHLSPLRYGVVSEGMLGSNRGKQNIVSFGDGGRGWECGGSGWNVGKGDVRHRKSTVTYGGAVNGKVGQDKGV